MYLILKYISRKISSNIIIPSFERMGKRQKPKKNSKKCKFSGTIVITLVPGFEKSIYVSEIKVKNVPRKILKNTDHF